MEHGWLVRDGQVLAALEAATTRAERRRGLRGRSVDSMPPAFLLRPCRQVHTFGVAVALDVAFCDDAGVVLSAARLERRRVSRVCRRAAFALEAPAGAFARWGLVRGDVIEVVVGARPEGA